MTLWMPATGVCGPDGRLVLERTVEERPVVDRRELPVQHLEVVEAVLRDRNGSNLALPREKIATRS